MSQTTDTPSCSASASSEYRSPCFVRGEHVVQDIPYRAVGQGLRGPAEQGMQRGVLGPVVEPPTVTVGMRTNATVPVTRCRLDEEGTPGAISGQGNQEERQ